MPDLAVRAAVVRVGLEGPSPPRGVIFGDRGNQADNAGSPPHVANSSSPPILIFRSGRGRVLLVGPVTAGPNALFARVEILRERHDDGLPTPSAFAGGARPVLQPQRARTSYAHRQPRQRGRSVFHPRFTRAMPAAPRLSPESVASRRRSARLRALPGSLMSPSCPGEYFDCRGPHPSRGRAVVTTSGLRPARTGAGVPNATANRHSSRISSAIAHSPRRCLLFYSPTAKRPAAAIPAGLIRAVASTAPRQDVSWRLTELGPIPRASASVAGRERGRDPAPAYACFANTSAIPGLRWSSRCTPAASASVARLAAQDSCQSTRPCSPDAPRRVRGAFHRLVLRRRCCFLSGPSFPFVPKASLNFAF